VPLPHPHSGRPRTSRHVLAAAVLGLAALSACSGTGSTAARHTTVTVVAPARVTAGHPAKASRSAPAIAARTAGLPDVLVPGDAPASRPAAAAVPVVAPVPEGPSVREIWADVRARHRAPRAYLPTPPRDVDCLHLKCIALTFDDGPGEGTEKLLEVLARTGVRATFFVLGRNVKADPGPTIRAAWDGHEIGVHTWDHRSLMGRGTEDIATDLLRTSDEITRTTGVRPTLVRPPYGDIDAATAARITKPVVLWSVDPDDWRDHDPALITQRIVDHAAPGSIVLMHDVYKETEQAVPAVIEHYQRRGYTFVTVSELYAGRLKAGRMYHGRELDTARARAKDRARGLPEPAAVGPMGAPVHPTSPFPPAPSAVPPPDPALVGSGAGAGDADEPDPTPDPTAMDPAAPEAPPDPVPEAAAAEPPESSPPPAPRGR
jgi:peptidoglycan/xylan/chitin deacetylase (PgdA/CDA1 family)